MRSDYRIRPNKKPNWSFIDQPSTELDRISDRISPNSTELTACRVPNSTEFPLKGDSDSVAQFGSAIRQSVSAINRNRFHGNCLCTT